MKKPDKSQAASAAATGCPDEGWVKKYPKLVEMMTTVAWDDDTPRAPTSISISCVDGMIQIAANDKDLKQSFYTTAGSIAEALGLLERAIAQGVDGWRPWKAGKRK